MLFLAHIILMKISMGLAIFQMLAFVYDLGGIVSSYTFTNIIPFSFTQSHVINFRTWCQMVTCTEFQDQYVSHHSILRCYLGRSRTIRN